MATTKDGSPELQPNIVQAPLESPLNTAHTLSRKAEVLTRRNQYEETIYCYSKAAECILQSMASCTSPTILESLKLQHGAYLTQMARLSTKTHLLTLADGTPSSFVSRATQTDSMHNMTSDEPHKISEDFVYQVLRENEDMQRNLSDKISDKSETGNDSKPKMSPLVKSPSDSACDQRSSWKCSHENSLSHCQNGVTLEDVLKLNEKLGDCVLGLLQELSSTHAEKKKIEERLSASSDSASGVDSCLKFTSLDLPPLENSYPELGQFSTQN